MEIEILINDNEEKLNKEYKIQKNDNNNTDNNDDNNKNDKNDFMEMYLRIENKSLIQINELCF